MLSELLLGQERKLIHVLPMTCFLPSMTQVLGSETELVLAVLEATAVK